MKRDPAKRYAIIIGVTNYTDAQIPPLQYTKNDAIRMADLLIRQGGFDQQRVYLLVNGIDEGEELPVNAIPPSRSDVLHRLTYAAKTAEQEDLILLFFAGHGTEVSTSPYLLTTDTKMDVLQETALKITLINEILEQSKASCIIKIFDACRSPFGEGRGTLGRMTEVLQQAMLKTATGWATFSSCSSGEVAHESGEMGHGIFSYYLCEGLGGKAANDSGEVPLERLVDYVKTSVGNWSDEQSRKQTPHFQSDLAGQIVLTTVANAPIVPPSDVQNPLDVLRFGIDSYLSRIPEDTRNLTFTDEKEFAEVMRLTESAIGQIVHAFSHPSLHIRVEERKSLDSIGGPASQEFHNDLRQKMVKSEFKGQMNAVQLLFSSSEVVLPHTTLTVGVGRFSFFYWLWFLHECNQAQLQGSFNADPKHTKGFFTFKPKAALDGRKMETVVIEMFKGITEDILSWSKQLGLFVDGRLTPLREIGKLVE